MVASIIRKSLTGRYFEPFVGGGAVFFELLPSDAFLSDLNPHLVETYAAIRDDPASLVRVLSRLEVSEEVFYHVREWKPSTRIDRAARFLFLNRTAFAGMYRENREGQYNVPFGGGQRTHRVLVESDLLHRASRALRSTELHNCDFQEAFALAQEGDVIYCDPPYHSGSNGGFNRYNGRVFVWDDQVRLATLANAASQRGVTVVVSNAAEPRILELYTTAQVVVLERPCLISRTNAGRRPMNEALLVLNAR